ncbi:hypothetical protein GDO81_021803 [Engystomops pustulosus]|uniref:Uncharacterized protein n=1 Tax=Engystomops pustulosus TaxID=76066 RepID=A0AAV6ZPN8_ENGPU|nr:hypothetical protein GDO81_021803 [Engystomops pustulosus]
MCHVLLSCCVSEGRPGPSGTKLRSICYLRPNSDYGKSSDLPQKPRAVPLLMPGLASGRKPLNNLHHSRYKITSRLLERLQEIC